MGVFEDVLDFLDEPLNHEPGTFHSTVLITLQDLHLLDARRPFGIGSDVGGDVIQIIWRRIDFEGLDRSFCHASCCRGRPA